MLLFVTALLLAPAAAVSPPADSEEEWVRTVRERQGYEPPREKGDWGTVLVSV